MLGEAKVAQEFARLLQNEGIYVTGFLSGGAEGQARIRTQISAGHTHQQRTGGGCVYAYWQTAGRDCLRGTVMKALAKLKATEGIWMVTDAPILNTAITIY